MFILTLLAVTKGPHTNWFVWVAVIHPINFLFDIQDGMVKISNIVKIPKCAHWEIPKCKRYITLSGWLSFVSSTTLFIFEVAFSKSER